MPLCGGSDVQLPDCSSQEKCSLCDCTRVDARVCLPCHHQFCHSCVEKNLPPDCPTMTACPKCNCDVDRRNKLSESSSPRRYDACNSYNSCAPPDYCNDFFCYNCIKERGPECRVKAAKFCLDCDVPLCENHLKQHKTFIKKKQHTMLPVSQYMLTKKKFENRKCKVHPKHNLDFVCTKCDVILCQVCVACCDCEKGGRHDARELDIVALEMAANINQSIKDVECVRLSGDKAIVDAQKEQKRLQCVLEQLKRDVRCKFQEQVCELQALRDEMISHVNNIQQQNVCATGEHRAQIQCMLKEALKIAKDAKKLLCYSHNVDIATEAAKTQRELTCMKSMTFPCLDLQGARLGTKAMERTMPCLSLNNENLTFCPQPCIPTPPPEDKCERCTQSPCPCPSISSTRNPVVPVFDPHADPCQGMKSPSRSCSPQRSHQACPPSDPCKQTYVGSPSCPPPVNLCQSYQPPPCPPKPSPNKYSPVICDQDMEASTDGATALAQPKHIFTGSKTYDTCDDGNPHLNVWSHDYGNSKDCDTKLPQATGPHLNVWSHGSSNSKDCDTKLPQATGPHLNVWSHGYGNSKDCDTKLPQATGPHLNVWSHGYGNSKDCGTKPQTWNNCVPNRLKPSTSDDCTTPETGSWYDNMNDDQAKILNGGCVEFYEGSYKDQLTSKCAEPHQKRTKMAFTVHNACNLTMSQSDVHCFNGFRWTIIAAVQRNDQDCRDYLGIFVKCDSECPNLSWRCEASLKLILVDQCDSSMSICKKTYHCYSQQDSNWGIKTICPWDEVKDACKHFFRDDAIRIKVEISVK